MRDEGFNYARENQERALDRWRYLNPDDVPPICHVGYVDLLLERLRSEYLEPRYDIPRELHRVL